MFEAKNKDTSFWCLFCELRTGFTHCYSISIVDFEKGKTGWVTHHVTRIVMICGTNNLEKRKKRDNENVLINLVTLLMLKR